MTREGNKGFCRVNSWTIQIEFVFPSVTCAFLTSPGIHYQTHCDPVDHPQAPCLPPLSRAFPRTFLFGPQHPLMPSSLVQGIPYRAFLLDPDWVYSKSLHWRYMFLAPYKPHSFLHWMVVASLSKLFLLWYEAPALHFLFCGISVRLITRTPNDLLQLWTKFSKPGIWVFRICPSYLRYFD